MTARTLAFRAWIRAVLADAEGATSHFTATNGPTPAGQEAPDGRARPCDNGRGAA